MLFAVIQDQHLHHIGGGPMLPISGRAQRSFKPGLMRKVRVVLLVVAMAASRLYWDVLRMYCNVH